MSKTFEAQPPIVLVPFMMPYPPEVDQSFSAPSPKIILSDLPEITAPAHHCMQEYALVQEDMFKS